MEDRERDPMGTLIDLTASQVRRWVEADQRKRARCDWHPRRFQKDCPACRQKLAALLGQLTPEGVAKEAHTNDDHATTTT
jgi:hypothetical protein